MNQPQCVESLSRAQRERLAYVDFRLKFFGEIDCPNLIERFGVDPAGATRDLALYREIAPQNITFDSSNKIYRIGQAFSPLFDHAPQLVLSARALRLGDDVNVAMKIAAVRVAHSAEQPEDGYAGSGLPGELHQAASRHPLPLVEQR
ncbi:hypothetical protein [Serratia marcescens]|uniref:hypothetical protein n=1 Tax=Serratia marcescens TaxID=615 RepID=UPI001FAE7BDD|nr:hypothetical protein [Serratia marcescens]